MRALLPVDTLANKDEISDVGSQKVCLNFHGFQALSILLSSTGEV